MGMKTIALAAIAGLAIGIAIAVVIQIFYPPATTQNGDQIYHPMSPLINVII